MNTPIKKIALAFLLLAALAGRNGFGAEPDSSKRNSPDSVSADKETDDPANPSWPTPLEIVTWPVEKVLVPGVKGALYPLKPPLRYFLTENVIDRTMDLMSFGGEDQFMIYPTLLLSTGTRSSTGLTLRYQSPFGRSGDRLNSFYNFHVNGDWRWRSYYYHNKIQGSKLNTRLTYSMNRVKNASLNQPETNKVWFYADSSHIVGFSASYPLPFFPETRFGLGYTLRDNHFGEAPPQEDELVSPFFVSDDGLIDRGFNRHWMGHVGTVSLSRDTRNNVHIPISGSLLETDWYYHFASRDYDYHKFSLTWSGYFKLGSEEYEMNSAEEREQFKDLDLKKMLGNMEYRKLREQVFTRKVVAVQIHLVQSFEVDGNNAPHYALNTLGNQTPMRGYSGSRFKDLAVAAVSMEYRFPLMRLVDGVLFNEYGNKGSGLTEIDYLASRNSWGFGVRVRRPDLSLFRVQLGFHGLQGAVLNLSVDSPY